MANIINRLKIGDAEGIFTLPYAECPTDGSIAEKAVALTDFSLEDGARIAVYFHNTNTATSSLCLNVNSTGAKIITGATNNIDINGNKVYDFIYLSSTDSWYMLNSINNGTISGGTSVGQQYLHDIRFSYATKVNSFRGVVSVSLILISARPYECTGWGDIFLDNNHDGEYSIPDDTILPCTAIAIDAMVDGNTNEGETAGHINFVATGLSYSNDGPNYKLHNAYITTDESSNFYDYIDVGVHEYYDFIDKVTLLGSGETVDTSNFVTLDGHQTITGYKKFADDISIGKTLFIDEHTLDITGSYAQVLLGNGAGKKGQVFTNNGIETPIWADPPTTSTPEIATIEISSINNNVQTDYYDDGSIKEQQYSINIRVLAGKEALKAGDWIEICRPRLVIKNNKSKIDGTKVNIRRKQMYKVITGTQLSESDLQYDSHSLRLTIERDTGGVWDYDYRASYTASNSKKKKPLIVRIARREYFTQPNEKSPTWNLVKVLSNSVPVATTISDDYDLVLSPL